MQLDPKSNRAASLRVARAASHLKQAGQQLIAAADAAPTRYHQQQLRRLTVDLRAFSVPIEGLASFLEHGGGR